MQNPWDLLVATLRRQPKLSRDAFEDLLDKLQTEEGRTAARAAAICSGLTGLVDVSIYGGSAVCYFARRGDYDAAMRVADRVGLDSHADRISEDVILSHVQTIGYLVLTGDNLMARIQAFEAAHRYGEAITLAKKQRLANAELRLSEKAGEFSRASHLARRLGYAERAQVYHILAKILH